MREGKLEKILLVDDDQDIQLVGKIGLGRVSGFEVQVCSSGAEALRVVSNFEPDMILLDVMMPGMDGPTTLKTLRSLPGSEELPVVFVTAKAQRSEIDRYMEMGALGVIKKPFDPVGLGEDLRRLWESSRVGVGKVREEVEIEDLNLRYREKLRARLERVQNLLGEAMKTRDRETVQEVLRLVHKLGGSGSIFGLPEVSEVCQSGEVVLHRLLESEEPLDGEELEKLQGACEKLRGRLGYL